MAIYSCFWTDDLGRHASAPDRCRLVTLAASIAIAGIGTLLVGVVAAFRVALRIREGIVGAVTASQSLVQGDQVMPVRSRISELASLSDAIVNAAERLQTEANERQRADAERARLIITERGQS